MTALAEILARRIRADGPMSLAEYMTLCLTHPRHGYYTTGTPLGAAGDFITAPEISQMFGEMLGLALAQAWMDQGAPAPFTLAELGPGRGTLMADILRATAGVPGFHAAMRLHLVEISPSLRRAQKAALAGQAVTWHDTAQALPDGDPLFLVANEFFDALPIRQFIRAPDGWSERVVGLSAEGALTFGLTPPAPIAALERHKGLPPGEMITTCPAGEVIAAGIGRIIADRGGLALIIDYGQHDLRSDTFQAVRGHQKVDPLDAPGQADLTAHVDFGALAAALPGGTRAHGPVPQGVLLERLGITARAQALASGLSGPALAQHVAAHRRLTHPQEMGTLFQAQAITADGAPCPPGFAP